MPQIRRVDIPIFGPGELEAIADILGNTDAGLTGSEIDHCLRQARITTTDPTMTKRKKLYNALADRHNQDRHGGAVLQFIRCAMDPARYAGQRAVFEERRAALNVPLAFVGLELGEDGRFFKKTRARTLSEAEERANRLRKRLEDRGVHSDVLRFCTAELVAENYFHAVLEATKSVAEKLRDRTGLRGDGAALAADALGGDDPLLRINAFRSDPERGEQRGFVSLLTGLFGVFRNPVAHAARITWPMPEEDALDLLVLASYAHRRIDRSSRR
jgi:uncharacterized protein (TIGR02391 family)